MGSRMTRNRQRCMLPPDDADTPASRILRINSAGTGSGFKRRIDRVVAMISNRSGVFSGITSSRGNCSSSYNRIANGHVGPCSCATLKSWITNATRNGEVAVSDMPGPPFRADHVGSLLRPPELLRARAEHQAGRLSAEELRRVEDTAIRDVARMQQQVGLAGVTDGEFRRGSWHMDFLYQIGGVAKTDQTLRVQFRNEAGPVEAALGAFRIDRRLTLDETIFAEDFTYLRSVAPAGTVAKLTIPSPSMLHYRGGRAVIDQAAYPEIKAFWHDLGEVYRKEIAGLAALGCTYLQLDDTSLAYLNDPAQRAYVTSIGGAGDKQHLTNIRLINA